MRYVLELADNCGSSLGEAVAGTADEAIALGVWYRTVGQVAFVNIIDTED